MPGLNGFQAVFFQKYWTMVGDDFAILFEKFFKILVQFHKWNRPLSLSFPRKMKLVLRKILGLLVYVMCLMSQLPSCSLWGLDLRPYMSKLIGPFQFSFVPGRQSGDKIIMAQ